MANYIVTYNIDDATNRGDFVTKFEEVLTNLGLHKEPTNQSTYFGAYRSSQDFVRDLHNAVCGLTWRNGDIVTIYYPKVTKVNEKNIADIGRHPFKSEGTKILNHIILRE